MDDLVKLHQSINYQTFVLQDKTAGGLDQMRVWNWAWCMNYQFTQHYQYSPWVERGYSQSAHCLYLPREATVPSGAWPVFLEDTSPEAGALGWHEDYFASKVGPSGIHSARKFSAAGETPEAYVFVKTCEEDGVDPMEVVSHECLETIVDPYVTKQKTIKVARHDGKLWIVEVGDPVQGNGYELVPGYTLADFAYPKWWDLPQTRPDLSFRNSVSESFKLAPGGYISVAPENEPEKWEQIYGQAHAPNAPAS